MATDNKINLSINETMEVIKEATIKILGPMEEGTRITIQDLKDKVIASTKLATSIVSGIIPIILANYDGGSISAGRNGGWYRGGKKQRVDGRTRCNECHQVLRKINLKD